MTKSVVKKSLTTPTTMQRSMTNYNRVKIARAINNQDMRGFAKETGYSPSFISRVESGERNIPEKLKDYCEVVIKMFIATELLNKELCACGNPKLEESDFCKECI